MVRMSTAPDLSRLDGLAPLERAARHRLMLGLFIPLQEGAWSPSTVDARHVVVFDYNAECTVRAEELGFDLVFGLAQWLGKGGYGGADAVPRERRRTRSSSPPASRP